MADRPPVKTRRVTRDKLALFLPSHELIKAFEDMGADVETTLPDAVEQNALSIEEVQNQAASGASQAAAATAIAMAADAAAQVEQLSSQVSSLREQLAAALTTINDLKQGYQL